MTTTTKTLASVSVLRWPWSGCAKTVVFVFAALLIMSGCHPSFRRNPNLRSLQVGTTFTLFNPVWSADGKSIYFLDVAVDTTNAGHLWVIGADGSGERLLLNGHFDNLCISHDGTRLAGVVSLNTERYHGSGMLLIDSAGTVMDTIFSPGATVECARFGGSAETLYFYKLWAGIYWIDIESGSWGKVMATDRIDLGQGFDIYDDSLLAIPGANYHIPGGGTDTVLSLFQPRFCPGDPDLLMGTEGHSQYHDDIVTLNRLNDSVTHLDAKPYDQCDIKDPCWSPDGKSIVISAGEYTPHGYDRDMYPEIYDLWILDRF